MSTSSEEDAALVLVCSCGVRMLVPSAHVGRTGKCKRCASWITVTSENTRPAAPYEVASARNAKGSSRDVAQQRLVVDRLAETTVAEVPVDKLPVGDPTLTHEEIPFDLASAGPVGVSSRPTPTARPSTPHGAAEVVGDQPGKGYVPRPTATWGGRRSPALAFGIGMAVLVGLACLGYLLWSRGSKLPSVSLHARVSDGAVELTWRLSAGSRQVLGFNVLRGPSSTGRMTPVNAQPLAPIVGRFRDTEIDNGVTYYYTVQAVGRGLRELARSAVVAVPTTPTGGQVIFPERPRRGGTEAEIADSFEEGLDPFWFYYYTGNSSEATRWGIAEITDQYSRTGSRSVLMAQQIGAGGRWYGHRFPDGFQGRVGIWHYFPKPSDDGGWDGSCAACLEVQTGRPGESFSITTCGDNTGAWVGGDRRYWRVEPGWHHVELEVGPEGARGWVDGRPFPDTNSRLTQCTQVDFGIGWNHGGAVCWDDFSYTMLPGQPPDLRDHPRSPNP